MAHVRRGFVEAAACLPRGKPGRAGEAIELLRKLYRVEREVTQASVAGEPLAQMHARRLAARQERMQTPARGPAHLANPRRIRSPSALESASRQTVHPLPRLKACGCWIAYDRQDRRTVKFYNLDAILAVGYWVRSGLHREHASKTDVRIIDFVDTGHPALLRMWDKRQRGYRAMGYRVGSDVPAE
jgi:hypothetical protein